MNSIATENCDELVYAQSDVCTLFVMKRKDFPKSNSSNLYQCSKLDWSEDFVTIPTVQRLFPRGVGETPDEKVQKSWPSGSSMICF